jgi:LPXTG-motif cell wall-anchored protein
VGEEPGRVEDPDASPTQEVAALESEIEDTRKKLSGYVSELDRRRHAALSTGPRRAFGLAAAGALVAAGAVLVILRRRRRRSLAGKAERFADALAVFTRNTRRSREEKSPGRKILVAAATAAAAQLARKLSAGALSSKKR